MHGSAGQTERALRARGLVVRSYGDLTLTGAGGEYAASLSSPPTPDLTTSPPQETDRGTHESTAAGAHFQTAFQSCGGWSIPSPATEAGRTGRMTDER
ncbi:hypothetical protein AA13594_2535 [Gluconacetobacter azotocaptans DSM 13594]|nr:hypothetical protein AA13594_2535 [Gluconacetobacter azotocaptans DSM 13594]